MSLSSTLQSTGFSMQRADSQSFFDLAALLYPALAV